MDPDVALATALDENATKTERADAAQDLLLWLYSGGYVPFAWLRDGGNNDTLRARLQAIRRERPAPQPHNPLIIP